MTGIDAANPKPPPNPDGRVRVTLPASRGGLAWLAVLLLVGSFLAFQVGRQVYASWSISREADALRVDISTVMEQNELYLRELDYVESDAFISSEARRLLNLGRPGERVLIIPPGSESDLPPALQAELAPPPPLLDQWLQLFFGP